MNDVIRACNYHLHTLRHIRHSLTFDVASTLAFNVICTSIDCCNTLLFDVARKTPANEWVQNKLARLVTVISVHCMHDAGQCRWFITYLHWLPELSHPTFKVAVLCFKAYQLCQPEYLSSLLQLQPYIPRRQLTSSALDQLSVPQSTTATSSQRFSAVVPWIWNSLPINIRSAQTANSFKNQLKTHLFRAAFD